MTENFKKKRKKHRCSHPIKNSFWKVFQSFTIYIRVQQNTVHFIYLLISYMQCFPSGQGKGGQIRSHWNFEVKQESCKRIQNNILRIGDSPKTPKVPLKQTPLILCNKPTLQEESKYHQNQHGSILHLKKKKGFPITLVSPNAMHFHHCSKTKI